MTLTKREVLGLLDAHDFRPSRALGQNFVVDPNTVRKIARLAGIGPGDRVVEVGPGVGSLTLALADTGAAVTAVEIDRHLLPILHSVLDGTGVTLVHGDAMSIDWDDLIGCSPGWVLVANLPYNVATPLVADILDFVPAVSTMLVMVQREVGLRLAARPGDAAYGAVSVKVDYWAEASVVARVSPEVFYPRPKVDSALVSLRRRDAPAVDPAVAGPADIFALVRAGFATRRKTLRRALAGLVDAEAFERAGIAPQSRAEELDVHAWGRLAAASSHPATGEAR